jgi:hypothetical protein
MTEARANFSAVVIDGVIYVAGGERGSQLSSVEALTP